MSECPTDEQLTEWLYDAEFDHGAVDGNHDFDANPLPRDTFPKYYSDDYNPTLAMAFRELLELRQRRAAVLGLCDDAPFGEALTSDIRRVLTGEEPTDG